MRTLLPAVKSRRGRNYPFCRSAQKPVNETSRTSWPVGVLHSRCTCSAGLSALGSVGPRASTHRVIPAKSLYRYSRESGNSFLRSAASAGNDEGGGNGRGGMRAGGRGSFLPACGEGWGGAASSAFSDDVHESHISPPLIPPHAGGRLDSRLRGNDEGGGGNDGGAGCAREGERRRRCPPAAPPRRWMRARNRRRLSKTGRRALPRALLPRTAAPAGNGSAEPYQAAQSLENQRCREVRLKQIPRQIVRERVHGVAPSL